MFPTRLQVKQRFLSLLDDPAAAVFKDTPGPGGSPSLFQNAFAEAYDVLYSAFLGQQVPRVERVVQGIVVAPGTTSLTPLEMGITDFADWDWLAERTYGSNDKFLDLYDEDRLTQRPMIDRLLETVYQDGAFQFVGATTIRELQMKYVSSSSAPTQDADVIRIDSSLNFLANYSAGTVGANKGYEAMAAKCMSFAVGPKFHMGMIGGELYRLTAPLVRSRQNVPVAHKPYTTTRRVGVGRRGIPYVAAQQGTTGGGSQNVPIQFSSAAGDLVGAIDGTNTVFYLSSGNIALMALYRNGVLQTPVVDYFSVNNQITFGPASVPEVGDTLTAEAWIVYGDYVPLALQTGGSSVSGYYIVPVAGGIAAPNLSFGNIQVVTLTQATQILAPQQLLPGPFWLKLIQDATGEWPVTFAASYTGIDPTAFSGPGVTAGMVTVLALAVDNNLQISYLGVTYGPV